MKQWTLTSGLLITEQQIEAAVVGSLLELGKRTRACGGVRACLNFDGHWSLSVLGNASSLPHIWINRGDSRTSISEKLVAMLERHGAVEMRRWEWSKTCFLTSQQIADAVTEAMHDIRPRLIRQSEIKASLWLVTATSVWKLELGDRASDSAWGITINRQDSFQRIVGKLIKAMDAYMTKDRLVGYVVGNRHNYLLELCQALKEAGQTKEQAKTKVEAWAQRHGDEDRSYIADRVYGSTFAEQYEAKPRTVWDECPRPYGLANRLKQVAEADDHKCKACEKFHNVCSASHRLVCQNSKGAECVTYSCAGHLQHSINHLIRQFGNSGTVTNRAAHEEWKRNSVLSTQVRWYDWLRRDWHKGKPAPLVCIEGRIFIPDVGDAVDPMCPPKCRCSETRHPLVCKECW